MDSITQAALGASIAGALAGKTLGRPVLLTGALLATLPDLDVLIDYGTAVANFTQHRGFSHSLFVLAPLSLLLAALLWRWKPDPGFARGLRRLEWFTRGFLDYRAANGEITATDVRLSIPGAHPFSFVLVYERDGTLAPADGERAPRPAMNTGALPLLWARTTGAIPVLCLASLATPAPGEEC